MFILGVETTCDETAAAVVGRANDGRGHILSDVVRSQISEHAVYGGVVPEIAARAHVEMLDMVIDEAMRRAEMAFSDLDGVAVAGGPGLVGGLVVGLTMAKAVSMVHAKPLLVVNHLEAHALSARLTEQVSFPYLLLLVSGGHTQLLYVRSVGEYRRLGTTVDDALGEAFDKTAKLLGLPYPGGPAVERAARGGDATRFDLPRPMLGRTELHFSFSGLKTAVRRVAQKHAPLDEQTIADLCASFQAAVAHTLDDRVSRAIEDLRRKETERDLTFVVAGGVASNVFLRAAFDRLCGRMNVRLVVPPLSLCTDNGAMIAWAGAERLACGLVGAFSENLAFTPRARWPLDPSAVPAPGAGIKA